MTPRGRTRSWPRRRNRHVAVGPAQASVADQVVGTSAPDQYHSQENHRRSSASGATTAARTPATSRSASARTRVGCCFAGPRIGLVPPLQLARMLVPFQAVTSTDRAMIAPHRSSGARSDLSSWRLSPSSVRRSSSPNGPAAARWSSSRAQPRSAAPACARSPPGRSGRAAAPPRPRRAGSCRGDRGDQVAAPGELPEPRRLRGRPRREGLAAGLVRLLVARLFRLGSALSGVRVRNPRSPRNAPASSSDSSAGSGDRRHSKPGAAQLG